MLVLCANLYLANKVEKNPFFQANSSLEHGKDILDKWSEFNRQYADRIIEEKCSKSLPQSAELFKQCFGNYPSYSLFYHLYQFAVNHGTFRITPEIKDKSTRSWQAYVQEERKGKEEVHEEEIIESESCATYIVSEDNNKSSFKSFSEREKESNKEGKSCVITTL